MTDMRRLLIGSLINGSAGLYPPMRTNGTGTRKRRTKGKAKPATKRRRKAAKAKRFVKGSRAAKAHMAKLRRMRRR